jgi:hypothetical protein
MFTSDVVFIMFKFSNRIHWSYTVGTSVADPADPNVFGPPGSVRGTDPDSSIIKQK